ncbi:hypothetical protein PBY51_010948 [Eleginops maclovinus]|uniref:Uncharacterized protein n=1 Tax=Eleginops maclovinus TaxID=56733 RepID=A0AAN7XB62_ELEMC|nr:hypothetical protein PBY51_010948 [Eleginops maclovinus]
MKHPGYWSECFSLGCKLAGGKRSTSTHEAEGRIIKQQHDGVENCTPCETLSLLSITGLHPHPFSPLIPSSAPLAELHSSPGERHVNLAPFERATGSGENKSAAVHGEFSQDTA